MSATATPHGKPMFDNVPDAVEFALLKKLYDSLNGSGWTTKSNWPTVGNWPATATSVQFGTWYGVTVTNGDITRIQLSNNRLTGKIPLNIGDLQSLITLNFYRNPGLTGRIPTSIGTIATLEEINLSTCHLSGNIPGAIFNLPALRSFDVSINDLTGLIPANVGNAAATLKVLSMGENLLTGDIPESLNNLVHLKVLNLKTNQLTGNIPASIGLFLDLEDLELSTNKLTGILPSNWANLKQLKILYLHRNQLTGQLPESLGELDNLEQLYLSTNMLSGTIPSSLGNLSKLKYLKLYENQLTGAIPAMLGNLTELLQLELFTNQLTGSIPESLGNLTKLERLPLYENKLTGAIPATIANIPNLDIINLSFNNLSGAIPSFLGQMNTLRSLYLHNNSFSGRIPSSLGNLSNLEYLWLNSNQLTGSVPQELTNLNRLKTLYLYNNQLAGDLPVNIFSGLTQITAIDISNNLLSGNFPASISSCTALTSLRAHKNKFTSISAAILSLPVLSAAHFSTNELTTVPNFSAHVNKARLTLTVSYNRLDFSTLIGLKNGGIKEVQLTPQNNIRDVSFIEAQNDAPLIVPARPFPAGTTVTWERQQSNGTWVNVNSLNEDATFATFKRNAFAGSDRGIYRWRMTNTTMSGTTIMCDAISVQSILGDVQDSLAFQYRYDGLRRVTKKKIPGADWVYMVYDDRDRIVLTQDGNQRRKTTPEWTFTKYDAFNRPVLTGIYRDSRTLDAMQAAVDTYYAGTLPSTKSWYEKFSITGSMHGYDNKSFPPLTSAADCMTVTYYDNYAFQSLIPSPERFNYDNNQLPASESDPAQDQSSLANVIGEVTGTKIKNVETGEWLWSVNHYDDKYQVIQAISSNHKGGTEKVTNVYDFTGKLIATKAAHSTSVALPHTMFSKFEYDHNARLTKLWHQMDAEPRVLLSEQKYNEIGQLITKKLHSSDNGNSFKQHEDFRYNIQGWLTRINHADLNTSDGGPKDYFGMELGYDNDLGIGTYTPQFNGNISALKWSANLGLALDYLNEPTERSYTFSYDRMNRLLRADPLNKVSNVWSSSSAYQEIASYDFSGNMTSLQRTNGNGSRIDWLVYDYGTGNASGSRLLSVTDNGGTRGLKDGNIQDTDFAYDFNGNLKVDRNKAFEIGYNSYLNLTNEILKEGGGKIRYIYDANGIKLAEEIYANQETTPRTRTDYIGPFVYQNDTLRFVVQPEGKVIAPKNTGDQMEYQYQIQDHLGNTRLTFTTKADELTFVATMEDNGMTDYNNPRVQEMQYFENLFETEIRNVNQWLNHTGGGSGNAIYLDGSEDKTIGPYTMLKVYPGDTVNMGVFCKYEEQSGYSNAPLATVLSMMLNPIQTAAIPFEGTGLSASMLSDGLMPFLQTRGSNTALPAAYLNYILFDRNFKVVDLDFVRITEAGGFDIAAESTIPFEELRLRKIIDRVGYIYVYVSNESPGSRVWMDDFEISLIQSPIVQFEDYYPFGLSMAGTAFERGNDNYAGMITTDGTGLKDLGFRQYDPAIGRFHAVDPLAELQFDQTTYQYAGNDPIRKTDLLGLEEYESADEQPGKDIPAKRNPRKREQRRRESWGYSSKKKRFTWKRSGGQRQSTDSQLAKGKRNAGTSPSSSKKDKQAATASKRTGKTADRQPSKGRDESPQGNESVAFFGPRFPGGDNSESKNSRISDDPSNRSSQGSVPLAYVNSVNSPEQSDDDLFPEVSVVESAYEAEQATDKELYRRKLYSRHPVNEALRLYARMLVTQKSSNRVKDVIAAMGNTSTSEDQIFDQRLQPPNTSTPAEALAAIPSTLPQSTHFPNVPPDMFLSQLRERTAPGGHEKTNQGFDTNFCWAAAIVKHVYENDPKGMADAMISLYNTGILQYDNNNGGLTVPEASQSARNAIGTEVFDNNQNLAEGRTINELDQMLFMTLADHYWGYSNANWDYDPNDEESSFWAGATLGKAVGVWEDFGYDIEATGSDVIGWLNTGVNKINAINEALETKDVVLFINSGAFKKNDQAMNITATHFIHVFSIEPMSGGQYKVVYWDYGRVREARLDATQFALSVYGMIEIPRTNE